MLVLHLQLLYLALRGVRLACADDVEHLFAWLPVSSHEAAWIARANSRKRLVLLGGRIG